MEKISSVRSFGGTQSIYKHTSNTLRCDMQFAVYMPEHKKGATLPVLYWLSGLTCTEENFITKAGAQRVANELGIVIIAPDTSPRGDGVPDDAEAAYDFGLGAGFYVDATQEAFNKHYKMYSYVTSELPALIEAEFPVDPSRTGVFGHSMGGHGALTIALKNPEKYKTVSAFSPIVSPINCPWGQKALGGYIGADQAAWRVYDACALINDGARVDDILVDQGSSDNFLEEQLKPELLKVACEKAGQSLTLRMQEGYDHSYYFIASFIEDHLRWHAERL
ncbi:S-formylglutathione hydrolase [Kordiimonas sp. SCSIO 12610]|uniref:S-formylglutathione hydrolase n=1 Tax=Kordiimonas sp. SCSIO 12610 TaxID=2829597 RepID=UPI00210EE000|nr:S-formylglutathione hydrolase [Kordiimonas sp. SCSIO 12610]UTW55352.1 S-formylglutathione hydrolase [Kordiimonas sp. SCSIO 12610]